MAPPRMDLTGQRFGKLVVIKFHGQDKYKNKRWECLCDCGNTSISLGHNLRKGDSTTCGCGQTFNQDATLFYGSVFGDYGQLQVTSHIIDNNDNLQYILECGICSLDPEMYGSSVFKAPRHALLKGSIPCGCNPKRNHTPAEALVKYTRKATELGYIFKRFTGEWRSGNTPIILECPKHGEWESKGFKLLLGHQCKECRLEKPNTTGLKPDQYFIDSFIETGVFPEGTVFQRTDKSTLWNVTCPDCKITVTSYGGNLRKGNRPCACDGNRKPNFAYINLVEDSGYAVAIKFGISSRAENRVYSQNLNSVYNVKPLFQFHFEDIGNCKASENKIKSQLFCGVLSKLEFKDGYTETTYVHNLDAVISIFTDFGGVKTKIL